jgi:pimeloyl-ACP methyl ester carboxylesterase
MSGVLSSLSLLERISPALAAEIVWRAWRTPRKPRTMGRDAVPVMDLAEESTVDIAGRRIALYRWGAGPRVILLVHGWEGRASDFAQIVRELRSSDRTILALDAPGHGKSSGKRTIVIDYGEVITKVTRRFGPLDAVVSHSLGTPSVAAAVGNGLTADRFVSISGVADLAALVPKFCEILGVGPGTVSRVRTRVEDRVFGGNRGVWAQYSAASSSFPASAPLLAIHDRSDRMVSVDDAAALADAHGPDTKTVLTDGLGHYKILSADSVLDEVSAFLDARVGLITR